MSHSRQPLVKGERLVRYEVNTVIVPEEAPDQLSLTLKIEKKYLNTTFELSTFSLYVSLGTHK